MPLMTIGKCFRGRTDCQSFDVVESTPVDVTDEQLDTLDYVPQSFVCIGCVSLAQRLAPQDAYRVCFKNAVGDEMSDNDEQDLVHLVKCATTALAVIASRRVARGWIDVPRSLDDGEMVQVDTQQGRPDAS